METGEGCADAAENRVSGILVNPERTWSSRVTGGDLDLRAEVVARVDASFDSSELLSGSQANLNVRLDRNRVLRIYVRDPAALEKKRLRT